MADLFGLNNFLFLMGGFKVTLEIGFFSIIFSVLIGTLVGIARYLRIPVLGHIGSLYVDIVRNIPCLLCVLIARFMTPLPPTMSGILAMSVFTGAIMAEIVRGGINSVAKGQFEAALSQGLSRWQIVYHIILPQAYRNIIPPMVSQFTTVIKDSSFVWAVGTEELTGRGTILIGRYSDTSHLFIIMGCVALIYFIVNYSLSLVARWEHRRLTAKSY
ncbi:amino acid ABC transporter permease [Pectinatus cerevisiiphilus]|uniref:Amino acid ABC transporter membrane protein 2 (PAAT family) n=1 Tax=Pectinatus cerevisiiphilus TaxID=86956 RepID=A0A4R3K581_9FIRM|nr:amino acid ABC transporter permease [Pectinatus cerevisiiphilus]TCS77978.1 amino acid ABC transporter membrane protein 2 (PAAT family) [Pectinatus cerevisiiphilus]